MSRGINGEVSTAGPSTPSDSSRRGGVEEVSDHGQEGAYDARYSADPEDPSFFTPGGSYLHTLFNAHIDTLLLPTLPSSPAIMIP